MINDFDRHIDTGRMRLTPMAPEILTLARYDFRAALRHMGIEFPKRGYGFVELFSKRRIYRAKSLIVRAAPDALLLTTMWIMTSKADGELLGEIGFKGPPAEGAVELGYTTRAGCREKGFMTEAVGAMCAFAFAQRNYSVSRICALTRSDNIPSQRVLQKNGFLRDGTRGALWYWRKDRQ